MSERIIHPQPEKGTKAEDFFANSIEVVLVSKDEFLERVKLKFLKQDDADILQTKGINFDQDGKTIILLRTDIFPEQYMPYLETHEKWEAYVARKPGYNLFKKSAGDYKKDKKADFTKDEDLQDFYRDIGIYNYDFRHEYAIYKEYQQAMVDGKLDEYHAWMMNLRTQEKLGANNANLELIENDTKIRESIYGKLKQNTKHSFLKK